MRGQLGHLVDAGFDVHFVTSFAGALPEGAIDPGVTLHSVGLRRELSPVADAVSVAKLAALIAKLRPQIVQAGTPKAALLGMIAARLVGVPVRIYHMRGLDHLAGHRGRALAAAAAVKTSCAMATRVLCVSESMRERLVSDGFCAAEKTHVHLRGSSNGVDAELRFNPALHQNQRSDLRRALGILDGSLVIGFVGRLVRDKGIETLFDAWQILREQFPEAILLLVGPFEKSDAVPARVREGLRLDPRIKHTQTDWGEAAPLYSAMDLVAFPSQREGFPNVPLEAAAMGLAVVASRVVGCVDAVVHGSTGILVEPRDPEALGRALARLLREPAWREALGEAGRARVLRDYRPRDLWAAQVAWYRSLLANQSSRVEGSP